MRYQMAGTKSRKKKVELEELGPIQFDFSSSSGGAFCFRAEGDANEGEEQQQQQQKDAPQFGFAPAPEAQEAKFSFSFAPVQEEKQAPSLSLPISKRLAPRLEESNKPPKPQWVFEPESSFQLKMEEMSLGEPAEEVRLAVALEEPGAPNLDFSAWHNARHGRPGNMGHVFTKDCMSIESRRLRDGRGYWCLEEIMDGHHTMGVYSLLGRFEMQAGEMLAMPKAGAQGLEYQELLWLCTQLVEVNGDILLPSHVQDNALVMLSEHLPSTLNGAKISNSALYTFMFVVGPRNLPRFWPVAKTLVFPGVACSLDLFVNESMPICEELIVAALYLGDTELDASKCDIIPQVWGQMQQATDAFVLSCFLRRKGALITPACAKVIPREYLRKLRATPREPDVLTLLELARRHEQRATCPIAKLPLPLLRIINAFIKSKD